MERLRRDARGSAERLRLLEARLARPARGRRMSARRVETRRKRLRIRAWRRGIKEMDLILGGYADADLAAMDGDDLALFEAVLGENDHDLFAWVTGQSRAARRYAPLMAELAGARAHPRGLTLRVPTGADLPRVLTNISRLSRQIVDNVSETGMPRHEPT